MSNLSRSSVCIKYLLFIFNLLFVVSGVIILSLGITIKMHYYDYELFLDDQYFSTPNVLIAIGSIIFIIAFFGCYGAIKESYCMTITFSTLLILIFILELAAGISGYVLRNQTTKILTEKLTETLKEYKPNATENNVTKLWNDIQLKFQCCGVYNYTDWLELTKDKLIPLSCCGAQNRQLGNITCNKDTLTLHKIGCVKGFGNKIQDNAVTIGIAALGLAFTQLLGIIFSCHFARHIKWNYEPV